MSNVIKEKQKALLRSRELELSQLLNINFDEVMERFKFDLLGCASGGSDERDYAREWLFGCFHQYFSSGDFVKDDARIVALGDLLATFNEPTLIELEAFGYDKGRD